jgi:hypothetical protein
MSFHPATDPSSSSTWLNAHHRVTIARVALYLGALAVLATGVAHIEQYAVDSYSSVPTIGTLFLLNFISALVITIGLVAPLRRIAGRFADPIREFMAVSGIGLAVLSLAALFISEATSLFGFTEHGYRMAIVVAIVVEVAATVFLVTFLVADDATHQTIHRLSRWFRAERRGQSPA